MEELVNIVQNCLQEEGWLVNRNDNLLAIGVDATNGRWDTVAEVCENDKLVFLGSVCPVKVPGEKRNPVAEYLMRVNRLTSRGTFAMDFDDGEVRFKTVLFAENEETIRSTFGSLLNNNIAMMDKFFPGILTVIASDKTPAEALSEILMGCPIDRQYIYN